MAIAAGIVQGHQAALVLGVDVGAVGEQELDDPGSVVAGGEMQRCRLPPVAGVAVDVEGSEKGQQLLLVPTVVSMVKPMLFVRMSIFNIPARSLQQIVLLVVGPGEDGLGERVGDVQGCFLLCVP